MAHCLQILSHRLVKQRNVVVRISVIRMDPQSFRVMAQRLRAIALLVEKVTEIEVRQRIIGIRFQSAPIVTLSLPHRARIEVHRPEIHQRPGRSRVQFNSLLVSVHDFGHRRAGLLQLETFFEPSLRVKPFLVRFGFVLAPLLYGKR